MAFGNKVGPEQGGTSVWEPPDVRRHVQIIRHSVLIQRGVQCATDRETASKSALMPVIVAGELGDIAFWSATPSAYARPLVNSWSASGARLRLPAPILLAER